VEQASVHALFARPEHPYTRELLTAVPDFGSPRNRTTPRGPSTGPTAPEPITDLAAEPAAQAAVTAAGLVVDFAGRLGAKPFRAVDAVSFAIAAGEVLGLVGESGSGKTTISRAVAGLTPVSGGELTVLGERIPVRRRSRRATLGSRAGQIGFVFQDPATSFNPLLTIGDCVAEPLLVHRRDLGRQQIRARTGELLESVHLPRAYADRYPHELSGGQRQRAALARALALRPRLLIADEPTSALDVSVQAKVLDLFTELQRELGFAALFVSHDLAVVEQVADRVAVLRRGRLMESGTTAQVLGAPQDDYTRRLIASLPVPDPVRQARRRPVPDAR
jgi:peptide/nickel transport system ATP-binding protein